MAQDHDTIKMRYEILGDSLQDLAAEYDLNPDALSHMAREDGWKQRNLPTVIFDSEPSDLATYSEQLLEASQHRLNILSIYNQLHLRPEYVKLEHALIAKALLIADKLEPNSPFAATQLKSLVESLNALSKRAGLLQGAATQGQKEIDDNGLTVQIIQQFNDKAESTPIN